MTTKNKKKAPVKKIVAKKPKDFTEITTIEAAFEDRKIDYKIMPDLSMLPERFREPMIGFYEMMVATEAVNGTEGKLPDYTDGSWKYTPWLGVDANKKHPSGFGFSCTNCAYWYTYTAVGSRLSLIDSERALHVARNFHSSHIKHKLK